jgi:protein phosphatase 1E
MELDGSEDYLVIGCDGLWDVVTHDEIVNHVYQYLEENNGDKMGVAQMLVRLAQECESEDNITVVVLFFRDKISLPVPREDDTGLMVPQGMDKPEQKTNDVAEMTNGRDSNVEGKPQGTMPESTDSSGSANLEGVGDGKEPENQDIFVSREEPVNKEDAAEKTKFTGGEELGSKENLGSKDTFSSKDIFDSKDTSGSKDCTESKAGGGSFNKGSSCVTSNSNSSPFTNRDKLRLSLHHLSFRDSKDSSDLVKDRKEKSSSRSSKARSAHSDTFSGGSGGSDIVLMSQAASKCIGNRRGRRTRNGRRRNNHRDNRRASRESQNSGIALRTNGTPSRVRSSSESKVSSFVRTPIPSSRSGGDHMFHMLMGCGAQIVNQTKRHSRWTVAIAMETDSAAAMFDEVIPAIESATLPRRQKKK